MPKYVVTVERYILQEVDITLEVDSAETARRAAIHEVSYCPELQWETVSDEEGGHTKGYKVQSILNLDEIEESAQKADIPWE